MPSSRRSRCRTPQLSREVHRRSRPYSARGALRVINPNGPTTGRTAAPLPPSPHGSALTFPSPPNPHPRSRSRTGTDTGTKAKHKTQTKSGMPPSAKTEPPPTPKSCLRAYRPTPAPGDPATPATAPTPLQADQGEQAKEAVIPGLLRHFDAIHLLNPINPLLRLLYIAIAPPRRP